MTKSHASMLCGGFAHARCLGHENLRSDRADDPSGDVVLKREDIGQFAIVFLSP
jgi:hypothetical protein